MSDQADPDFPTTVANFDVNHADPKPRTSTDEYGERPWLARAGASLAVSGWTHHRESYGDALLCALMEWRYDIAWFLAFDGFNPELGIATFSLWCAPNSTSDRYTREDSKRSAKDAHAFVTTWLAGWRAAKKVEASTRVDRA